MNAPHRIVFMGTPEFAVATLHTLHRSGYQILLVVTQPDRPRGRGRHLQPPPVKTAAQDLSIELFQPEKVRAASAIDRVAHAAPDWLVVVAFGQILPPGLLAVPTRGAINIHASLLPRYRGPAPIQRAIIDGESETGVTTMLMDEGLDTGDILLTAKTLIGPKDSSATLHDRLSRMGADLLLQTLDGLVSGKIRPRPQDHTRATYAPMLKKSEGQIDWSRTAGQIDAAIRGMDPWPGAFTILDGNRLRIYHGLALPEVTPLPPGTVIESFPGELRVATGGGVLSILELQGKSGKRLTIEDFLRGRPIPPGTVLG